MDINTEFIRKFKIFQSGIFKKQLKAIQMIIDHTAELYTKKIFSNPDKYVWMSYFIPPEIFHAMDLVMLECDMSGGWLCAFGLGEKLLNFTEQELGIGQVCTFHKVWIGALHNNLLPVPKAVAATHYSCESAQKAATYMHETFGTEYFILDIPRIKTKEAKNYLKKQLMELTDFLADVTRTKFDLEKLKEAIHYSNLATDYWKKAQDLRMGKPLLEGLSTLRHTSSSWLLCGTKKYVEIAKTLYSELKTRSQSNIKIMDEKCRLMWVHMAPYYITKMPALNNLERSLGAPIVIEALSYPYYGHINEEDPFLGLAEKILAYYFLDIYRCQNEFLTMLAKKFRVDGAIQLRPFGCRMCQGFSRMFADSFKDIGIPTLPLDVDTTDSRQYSDSQARTRVEAFVESLLIRRTAEKKF